MHAATATSGAIKVFNLGLPRTGTTSWHMYMQSARLNSLHSNHGEINKLYPHELQKFRSGAPSAVDVLIEQFDSMGDLPWYDLAEELVGRSSQHPDWRFVASTRDVSSWIRSIEAIVLPFVFDHPRTSALWRYHDERWNGTLTRVMAQEERSSRLRTKFERHYRTLRALGAPIHFVDLRSSANTTRVCRGALALASCPDHVPHENNRSASLASLRNPGEDAACCRRHPRHPCCLRAVRAVAEGAADRGSASLPPKLGPK